MTSRTLPYQCQKVTCPIIVPNTKYHPSAKPVIALLEVPPDLNPTVCPTVRPTGTHRYPEGFLRPPNVLGPIYPNFSICLDRLILGRFHGCSSRHVSFTTTGAVLIKRGTRNGSGLLRTIRLLTALGARHADHSHSLIRRPRPVTRVDNAIRQSLNAARLKLLLHRNNNHATLIGNRGLHHRLSFLKRLGTIRFSDLSLSLIQNKPKRQHA